MTIEELYKLREELVENKEKFSALNAKYNELLSKLFEKKGEKREATEAEFIKGESCIWYWGRFLILMAITLIFKVPNDVALLCIFLNLAIKVIDEHVILPKLWIRKKIRGKSASKEEKDQSELYEEVSKAREKYHECF